MWYSVTYQGLTIPLFWYSTALTIRLFYDALPYWKIVLFIAQIICVSFFIILFHASELLYYLITFSVILVIHAVEIRKHKNRYVLFIVIPFVIVVLYFLVRHFLPMEVPLFSLFATTDTVGQVVEKINTLGHGIVSSLNRFPNSFSEIAMLSLAAGLIFRVNSLFMRGNRSYNASFLDLILALSLLFFLIPMVPFLAGLAGYLTYDKIVWRFFFASPWFILIPFMFYQILSVEEIEIPAKKFFGLLIGISILIFIAFSQFRPYVWHGALKGNVTSLINSLDKNKVGMHR